MSEGEQTDTLYEELATEAPEREVGVLDEESGGETKRKSLAEKLEETSELTDMQSAVASLFPGELGNDVANKTMIGRIAPDVFISALKLMTIQDLTESDPDKPINVVRTMMKNYVLLSIGLDGKGRIDLIELAGANKETEELEKLGKGLFG